MNFYTIFTRLCDEKKVSPARAAADMGLSSSTTTKWARGSMPSGSSMKKIAEYFDVSMDTLISDAKKEDRDTVERSLTAEEWEYLQKFRNADDSTKEMIRRLFNA